MTAPSTEDAELVRRLRQRDAAAAGALYRSRGSTLLRFALALCGCRQTAEDIVHDTFVELLRYPERFDPERGTLNAYLYSIARHRSARLARTARRLTGLGPDEPSDDERTQAHAIEVQDSTTEDIAERAHTIEAVRAAMLDLPQLHREVIALCDLEELPYTDVAVILDCPIGTVRSRLHRARAQLAQRLEVLGFRENGEPTAPSSTMLACRGTVT